MPNRNAIVPNVAVGVITGLILTALGFLGSLLIHGALLHALGGITLEDAQAVASKEAQSVKATQGIAIPEWTYVISGDGKCGEHNDSLHHVKWPNGNVLVLQAFASDKHGNAQGAPVKTVQLCEINR